MFHSISIKHKIYKIQNGLLVKPTRSGYTGYDEIYTEYDTQEEAMQAMLEKEDYASYVILPVAQTFYVYDD